MNSFKLSAKKYRTDQKLNLRAINRQQSLNIVSRSWREISECIIINSFLLTGAFKDDHQSYLKYEPKLREALIRY